MTMHLELKQRIEERYRDALAGPLELKQDALLVHLRNGVSAELRFASRDEYSIAWRWGDAELRIDTAPLHAQLATFPNHLHDADGRLRSDALTRPRGEPCDNACAVIDALLADPLLRPAEGSAY